MSTVIMLALCAACVGDTWGLCSFEFIVSMLLLACVVGSAIGAFGATLFGERFR